MGADVSDDVGDLRVAHHVADRRHAFEAPKHHAEHELGRAEVLVVRERRIGAGADRAFRVRLMAGGADMTVQVRPALFRKFPPVAHAGVLRRRFIGQRRQANSRRNGERKRAERDPSHVATTRLCRRAIASSAERIAPSCQAGM